MNDDDAVRTRAYEIWEHEGRPQGQHESHWHRAMKELGIVPPTEQPPGTTVAGADLQPSTVTITEAETAPSEPSEFLTWWVAQHIDAGTQMTDANKIAGSLVADGDLVGIGQADLEQAAGKPLAAAVEDAIKRAIEERLL